MTLHYIALQMRNTTSDSF